MKFAFAVKAVKAKARASTLPGALATIIVASVVRTTDAHAQLFYGEVNNTYDPSGKIVQDWPTEKKELCDAFVPRKGDCTGLWQGVLDDIFSPDSNCEGMKRYVDVDPEDPTNIWFSASKIGANCDESFGWHDATEEERAKMEKGGVNTITLEDASSCTGLANFSVIGIEPGSKKAEQMADGAFIFTLTLGTVSNGQFMGRNGVYNGKGGVVENDLGEDEEAPPLAEPCGNFWSWVDEYGKPTDPAKTFPDVEETSGPGNWKSCRSSVTAPGGPINAWDRYYTLIPSEPIAVETTEVADNTAKTTSWKFSLPASSFASTTPARTMNNVEDRYAAVPTMKWLQSWNDGVKRCGGYYKPLYSDIDAEWLDPATLMANWKPNEFAIYWLEEGGGQGYVVGDIMDFDLSEDGTATIHAESPGDKPVIMAQRFAGHPDFPPVWHFHALPLNPSAVYGIPSDGELPPTAYLLVSTVIAYFDEEDEATSTTTLEGVTEGGTATATGDFDEAEDDKQSSEDSSRSLRRTTDLMHQFTLYFGGLVLAVGGYILAN